MKSEYRAKQPTEWKGGNKSCNNSAQMRSVHTLRQRNKKAYLDDRFQLLGERRLPLLSLFKGRREAPKTSKLLLQIFPVNDRGVVGALKRLRLRDRYFRQFGPRSAACYADPVGFHLRRPSSSPRDGEGAHYRLRNHERSGKRPGSGKAGELFSQRRPWSSSETCSKWIEHETQIRLFSSTCKSTARARRSLLKKEKNKKKH